MSMSTVSSLFFSLALISLNKHLLLVVSYPIYPARIPNGQSVPNPCQPGNNWPGVGHQAVGGAGPRNPFGLDFAANDFMWNSTLCQKDSDQDGFTNGKELGDPNCLWREGEVPENTIGITHPGVCEPVDSMNCMTFQPWLVCPANFSCPDFDLPDTENITIRIPHTNIPAEETYYMCQGFKLPQDRKYHMIGQTPVINNTQAMHHMLLYGCRRDLEESELEPFRCSTMGIWGCEAMIGSWGVGHNGQCHDKEFGFPMGAENGFKTAVLQIHWNNPMLENNWYDSSGMTLYYTAELRPNDGKMLLIGQQNIVLPPRQPRIHVPGTCMSVCTELLPESNRQVNITAGMFHMHFQGKSGDVQIIRKGGERVLLINETDYDYNSPKYHSFEEHIKFNAGDEILMNCVYDTTNKDVTTEWGEGTSDEMCFSFLTVYPSISDFDDCTQYKELPICSLNWGLTYPNCDTEAFWEVVRQALAACDDGQACTEGCVPLSQNLAASSCLEGSVGDWIRFYFPMTDPRLGHLFKLLETCGKFDETSDTTIPISTTNTTPTIPMSPLSAPFVKICNLTIFLATFIAIGYNL